MLKWITQKNLLPKAPPSPMSMFPSDVVAEVLRPCVSHLLTCPAGSVSSHEHALWALRTCGQAFALPIRHLDVIESVLSLYRRWLLDRSHLPTAFAGQHLEYLRIVVQYISVLFDSDLGDRSSIEDLGPYVSICKRALALWRDLFRQRSGWDDETWTCVLSVSLGLCDCLFDRAHNLESLEWRVVPALADEVSQVCFEMFLLAGNRLPKLWKALCVFFPNWSDILPMLHSWSRAINASTQAVLRKLYGPTAGTEHMDLYLDPEAELAAPSLFYAWRQLVLLVERSADHYQQPRCFSAVCTGLGSVISAFLRHCRAEDGNTVLEVFGKTLFQSVGDRLSSTVFADGVAVAVGALLQIVSTCNHTHYNESVLRMLFDTLGQILRGRIDTPMIRIVLASVSLFRSGLPSLRSLAPAYLYALYRIGKREKIGSRVLPTLEAGQRLTMPELMGYCIRILGSMVSRPSQSSSTWTSMSKSHVDEAARSKIKEEFIPLLTANDCYTVNLWLQRCLIVFIDRCSAPDNVTLLLWTSCHIALEFQSSLDQQTRQLSAPTIDALMKCIETGVISWSAGVMTTSLRVMSTLVAACCSNAYEHSAELALRCANLCISLIDMSARQRAGGDDLDELMCHAMVCLGDIVTSSQWLSNLDAGDDCVSQLSRCLSNALQKRPSASLVHQTADLVLHLATSVSHGFPMYRHNAFTMPVQSEEHLLAHIGKTLKWDASRCEVLCRSYAIDSKLLVTTVDRPDFDGVTLVTRSKYGKSMWHGRFAALSAAEEATEAEPHPPVPGACVVEPKKVGAWSNAVPACPNMLELGQLDANPVSTIAVLLADVEPLSSSAAATSCNVAPLRSPQASFHWDDGVGCQVGQQLLVHLGLPSLIESGRALPLKRDTTVGASLRALDDLPNRLQHVVGVVRVPKGMRSMDSIINAQQESSPDFDAFVQCLGCKASVSSGVWSGGLRVEQHGDSFRFWANALHEMAFHVATDIASSSASAHRAVFSTPALVVWVEDPSDYVMSMWSQKARVHVIVHPSLDGATYCCRSVRPAHEQRVHKVVTPKSPLRVPSGALVHQHSGSLSRSSSTKLTRSPSGRLIQASSGSVVSTSTGKLPHSSVGASVSLAIPAVPEQEEVVVPASLGPVAEGSVAGAELVGSLIRQTIINASVLEEPTALLKPMKQRSSTINMVSRSNTDASATFANGHLRHMFTTGKPERSMGATKAPLVLPPFPPRRVAVPVTIVPGDPETMSATLVASPGRPASMPVPTAAGQGRDLRKLSHAPIGAARASTTSRIASHRKPRRPPLPSTSPRFSAVLGASPRKALPSVPIVGDSSDGSESSDQAGGSPLLHATPPVPSSPLPSGVPRRKVPVPSRPRAAQAPLPGSKLNLQVARPPSWNGPPLPGGAQARRKARSPGGSVEDNSAESTG